MPNVGAMVDTPRGPGRVIEVNVLKGLVRVQLPDEGNLLDLSVNTCFDGSNDCGRHGKKD